MKSSQHWKFENRDEFLAKLTELRKRGTDPALLEVLMPYPVHEAQDLMAPKPSRLRYFTLVGGLIGMATGFAFPILTVKSWPLITGGKPLISIPPFVIIAFALTILFSSVASLLGFLYQSRLPAPDKIAEPDEHENYFVIRELPRNAGAAGQTKRGNEA